MYILASGDASNNSQMETSVISGVHEWSLQTQQSSPLDGIFLLYQCPTFYFLVSQSKAAIGQTIPTVTPTRRTRNLARKHTAMIGEIILNNAPDPPAENSIYPFPRNEYVPLECD